MSEIVWKKSQLRVVLYMSLDRWWEIPAAPYAEEGCGHVVWQGVCRVWQAGGWGIDPRFSATLGSEFGLFSLTAFRMGMSNFIVRD